MLGFVPQPNLQTSLYPINLYKKMRISSVVFAQKSGGNLY